MARHNWSMTLWSLLSSSDATWKDHLPQSQHPLTALPTSDCSHGGLPCPGLAALQPVLGKTATVLSESHLQTLVASLRARLFRCIRCELSSPHFECVNGKLCIWKRHTVSLLWCISCVQDIIEPTLILKWRNCYQEGLGSQIGVTANHTAHPNSLHSQMTVHSNSAHTFQLFWIFVPTAQVAPHNFSNFRGTAANKYNSFRWWKLSVFSSYMQNVSQPERKLHSLKNSFDCLSVAISIHLSFVNILI